MRGGGNDETVSTGCGPPSVLRPGCYCYICKRQFCGFTGWAFCPLEGGAQVSWMLLLHMQETVLWIHRLGLLSSRGGGPDILAPVLQFLPLALFWATYRVPCSVISVVVRWYSVLRMTFCTRSIVSIKACVPCS